MGALLGLAAAIAYGVSDFVAGVAARRLHYLWVSLVGAAVGLVGSAVALVWLHGDGASVRALAWGALSGVGSTFGTLALYRGYGHGQMAVAGPLSAVGAAAFPAIVGVFIGDRLPLVGVAGVLVALVGIWLVARSPAESRKSTQSRHSAAGSNPTSTRTASTGAMTSTRTGTIDGIVSGAGFGLLFVALAQAGDRAGLWPIVAGMVVATAALAVAALVWRPRWEVGRRSGLAVLAGAGLLSISANVLYFLASQQALLTVAAVLTSLYPAFTVAMAALILGERPDRGQRWGLVLSAVAVVAIVVA